MIISFKSRNVQVFDDGVHEWMTKKGRQLATRETVDKFNREKCWYAPAGGAPYL